MIKGLLNSASSMNNIGNKSGGLQKFMKGMTGKTSADYQARVMGVGEKGEYLSPEERKARFKGFALGTQSVKKTPTAARLALPAAQSDSGGGTGKLTDHLAKVTQYLEKLLVLENNAIDRLHDRVLGTSREIDTDAAEAEEKKQERGKVKGRRKKDSGLMKGIKKKAGGIFDFLMQFGKVFVGFKLLEWLSDPANLVKVTTFVNFFSGVIEFVGKIAKAIGTGISWTIEKLGDGINLIKDTVNKLGEFFSFEWFDVEGLQESFEDVTKIFTEGIPKVFEDINNFLLEDLPDMFSGMGESIAEFFKPLTDFLTTGLPTLFNDVVSGVFSKVKELFGFSDDEKDESDLFEAIENETDLEGNTSENTESYEKGGLLRGPRHSGGGVPIEAEGGEYVLNRNATAGIERSMPGFLDSMNFGTYPARGSGVSRPTYKFGGYVGSKFNAGGIVRNYNLPSISPTINLSTPKMESGGLVPNINLSTPKMESGGLVVPSLSNQTGGRLSVAQVVSNNILMEGGDGKVVIHEQGSHFTSNAEQTAFDSDSLGNCEPPINQCLYGVRY